MIYTPDTKKAIKLCFEAHRNQTDKSGLPYVFHPFHVAEQMPDEETTIVALLHAITQDKAIQFRYYDYTVTKERRFRKDGACYEISPLCLMWDDENYYMLGYDTEAEKLKHYRVDKMTDVSALDRPRDGKDEFKKVDMSQYSKKVFGMFTGDVQTVRLRFENHLAGPVIDRFGRDTMILASDENHFMVSVNVAVSPQFFAWVFGFGTAVEILAPDNVREDYKRELLALTEKYK